MEQARGFSDCQDRLDLIYNQSIHQFCKEKYQLLYKIIQKKVILKDISFYFYRIIIYMRL